MTGAEIAWRTLARERVTEPCIIGAWIMKRDFFRKYGGVGDIYRDPVKTAVDAYANAGCNLNPQFIMPSPFQEHRACDPRRLPTDAAGGAAVETRPLTAEDVRDDIESRLEVAFDPDGFDHAGVAASCADELITLRNLSRDRTLYISGFAMPSFMAGYSRWTYISYLSALLLYSDHFKSFFMYEAKAARERNRAIAFAIAERDIAPVVYTGDDICFNDGPICSVELLDEVYFPALAYAIEPLVEAGVEIVWHCDGNVLPITQRLIDIGITGFQGFQEEEAKIPFERMATFRRLDGSNLIFFGSMSVVHTFPFGTPRDIELEIERCFRVAGREGGFCLAPTSSVLPETPMENIDRFFEYGIEYGRRFLAGG
jgi:hypothetical protein